MYIGGAAYNNDNGCRRRLRRLAVSNERYNLSIIRVDPTNLGATADQSLLVFGNMCENLLSNYPGYDNGDDMPENFPFIKFLGFEENTAHGAQLFGVTEGFNGDGARRSEPSYVFRVIVDPTTKNPSDVAGDLKMLLVSHVSKGHYLGIRPQMEYDSATGHYHLHCLFWRDDRKLMYSRLTPDDDSNKSNLYLIHKEVEVAHEAVWHGSTTTTVGGEYTGYEAYYAIGVKKVEYLQAGGNRDMKKSSYGVGPALITAKSCHLTNEERKDVDFTTECQNVVNTSISISSQTRTQDFSKVLSSRLFDYSQSDIAHEELCNSGYTAVSSASASSNSFVDQCYNYGALDSLTFSPPLITNPTSCTDGASAWAYTYALTGTSPSSPLPSNI